MNAMNDDNNKPLAESPDLQAAIQRLRSAQAAAGAAIPLLSGRETTDADRAAMKAANEELAAATAEMKRLNCTTEDQAVAATADAFRNSLSKR